MSSTVAAITFQQCVTGERPDQAAGCARRPDRDEHDEVGA